MNPVEIFNALSARESVLRQMLNELPDDEQTAARLAAGAPELGQQARDFLHETIPEVIARTSPLEDSPEDMLRHAFAVGMELGRELERRLMRSLDDSEVPDSLPE